MPYSQISQMSGWAGGQVGQWENNSEITPRTDREGSGLAGHQARPHGQNFAQFPDRLYGFNSESLRRLRQQPVGLGRRYVERTHSLVQPGDADLRRRRPGAVGGRRLLLGRVPAHPRRVLRDGGIQRRPRRSSLVVAASRIAHPSNDNARGLLSMPARSARIWPHRPRTPNLNGPAPTASRRSRTTNLLDAPATQQWAERLTESGTRHSRCSAK